MPKKKTASKGTRTARMASTPLDKVSSQAEKLMERISNRADEAASSTGRKACKLVLSVIDFQKTTFDNTFKIISQLQEQSEKMVSTMVTDSHWVPKEGKSVVKEWVQMLQTGRSDFRKTVDKSFDLLTDYFERVQKEGIPSATTAKKSTTKKSTAKKSTAKKSTPKKSTAKKSTAKKSTPKKSTAKKPAAKKSTAKKKSTAS
ncbi:MAG: histone H1-like repetitive region-containing protein [Candidatus Hydrogenedentota bacterium]